MSTHHPAFPTGTAKGKAGWCVPARFARALAMLVLAAGLYGTPAFPVDKQASGGAAAEPQSESLWNRGTLTGSWAGVRTQLETAGIKLSVQEQSEVWANLTGGGRTGTAYDGLTTARDESTIARTWGWTGMTFLSINAFQIHGRGHLPSSSRTSNW
jgi:porin